MKYFCDNCGWHDGDPMPLKDAKLRLNPGDTFPSGECSHCGCMCFTESVMEKIAVAEAATELLEALERVVSWAKTYGLDVMPYRTGCSTEQPVIARARSAIAKASGRES